MSGNVVPKSGPAMEKVYDSMGDHDNNANSNDADQTTSRQGLKQFRENNVAPVSNHSYHIHGFHKIPNPELQMYIYPHLGGRDQIPVPGYTTEFNVYEQDYYAL